MAELLTTFSALGLSGGGATGAATATAGVAATTATTAAAGIGAASSSALSILQGVATAVSALGAIGGGLSAANASNEAATATELQAGQEQLASEQRSLTMKRELMKVLGENDVAFAAAGIDVGSGGIAEQTRTRAKQDAATDININRSQDEYRRALMQARARGLRRRGGEQVFSGLLSAVGTGVNYGMDLAGRG
jgi:hypothetical protein